MKVTFFESAGAMEEWLEENHSSETELWIGFFKKGSGRVKISYQEALDAALCFGWIDGLRKSIDDVRFKIRFTPRKARSIWSAINIKRAGELEKLGRMKKRGLTEFHGRDVGRMNKYSFEQKSCELSFAMEKKFRANAGAWQFFQGQPPGYRRVATWWVISPVREETKLRRLATLIDDSGKRRRIGAMAITAKKSKK